MLNPFDEGVIVWKDWVSVENIRYGNASKRLMSKLASKPKKLLTYPNDTAGSKLAAEMRKKANKLSSEEKSHYLRKAMALIWAAA
jgi:hypothetical protein